MTEVHDLVRLEGLISTLILQGIRKATAWYNDHISITHPPIRGRPTRELPIVVLMTEDAENRRKAESEQIPCVSGARAPRLLPVIQAHSMLIA
jgi:hypothetical protein